MLLIYLLLLGLFLVTAFVVVVALIVVWRATRPGMHTYWDSYTFVPSDMAAPYEDVRFTTADGLTMAAWFMPRSDSRATIIVGSGYRERKVSMLPIATGLWRNGFNVLLMDFRNQGDSDYDKVLTMGWREVQDMLAAVNYVTERIPQGAIGATGWSMGAVVSIMAAAQDERIKAVAADSAYADQGSVIAHYFCRYSRLPAFPFIPLAEVFFERRAGYRPSRVRPEDVIARIAPRPVLLIHGGHDDICPVEHVHRLFARAGQPKELWIVEQAKHVGAYFADPDAYIARVAAFFRTHLQAGTREI